MLDMYICIMPKKMYQRNLARKTTVEDNDAARIQITHEDPKSISGRPSGRSRIKKLASRSSFCCCPPTSYLVQLLQSSRGRRTVRDNTHRQPHIHH